MSDETELPEDVIAAIRSNRKIDAIKLLRGHRNLGLKEAKHIVDAYVAENPSIVTASPPRADSGIGRLVLLALGFALAYFGYRFFV